MSHSFGLVKELEATHKFFKTTIAVFEPADAGFAPSPELYTVAGHIAHAADSVDWFMAGAFGEGWDMDFEGLIAKAKAVTSLEEALGWFDQSFASARALVVDPILVLADEPTGNLDTETSAQVMELLHAFNERSGTSFLIVTHEQGMADDCRRIVHMVDGAIAWDRSVGGASVSPAAPS